MWPFRTTIDAKSFSLYQRRKLLDSFAGKIYSARWVTKDGRDRKAKVKTWRYAALTYGLPPDINPVAHIPHYWTASDLDKSKEDPVRSWVNIHLDNLIEIRCGRKTYRFV